MTVLSKKELLFQFDSNWMIRGNTTTIEEIKTLLSIIDVECLSQDAKDEILTFATSYRDLESKRFLSEKADIYHIHGLVAGWVLLSVIKTYHKKLCIVDSRFSNPKFLISLVFSAFFHDIGGSMKRGDIQAISEYSLLDSLLTKYFEKDIETQEYIFKLLKFADYSNPENPVNFDFKGNYKFDWNISIDSLLIVFCDFMQIGAFDYKKRVQIDLLPIEDTIPNPPALLWVIASTIAKLAEIVDERDPLKVVPIPLRERARMTFISKEEYGDRGYPTQNAMKLSTRENLFNELKSLLTL